ncbi:MAG: type II secretion system major pseudopilin GspG [Nitrospirae bacterium]|nr:type II secretion system major pseudopilin GspG [Nitrospirota bacterium]
MSKRKDAGFTLLEIMIAVAIVVMFSTVVGVAVYRYFSQAQVNKAKVDIKNIESALELYRTNCLKYPGGEGGIKALLEKPGDCEGWAGPYIKAKNVPKDPWGHEYVFTSPGASGDYDLASGGPDGAVGGGDDITLSDIQ